MKSSIFLIYTLLTFKVLFCSASLNCERQTSKFNDSSIKLVETACAYGDPVIYTFDGVKYELNKDGDYIFLKNDKNNIEAQVRIQLDRNNGKDMSIFKAIAIGNQLNSIQLVYTDLHGVNMYYNGLTYSYNPPIKRMKLGIFYIQVDAKPKIKFHIQYENDIKTEVSVLEHGLFIHLQIDASFKNRTKGLLGVVDGNSENDFTLPDGTKLYINAKYPDEKDIIRFTESWKINPHTSLFRNMRHLSHHNANDDNIHNNYDYNYYSSNNRLLANLKNFIFFMCLKITYFYYLEN